MTANFTDEVLMMIRNGARLRLVSAVVASTMVVSFNGGARASNPPGTMIVSPTTVSVAQQNLQLTFTFTVGTNGFANGGFIEILFNSMKLNQTDHKLFDFLMSPPQHENSNDPGYVSACTAPPGEVDCDSNGVGVTAFVEPESRIAKFTAADVLTNGAKIIMTYKGKMRNNAGTIVWKYRTDADALGGVEPPGAGNSWLVGITSNGACTNEVRQEFTFEPELAAYIQLTAPADLVTNGEFTLALVAFDQYANEAKADSGETVNLRSSDGERTGRYRT